MNRIRGAYWGIALCVGCFGGCAPEPTQGPSNSANSASVNSAPANESQASETVAPPHRLERVEFGNGTPVVVLLHGYGARGDDLVPLARTLHRQVGGHFLLPAAPLPMEGAHATNPREGGRWFGRRATMRGARSPHPEIQAAQQAVSHLLAELDARGISREDIVLGGFSQGAMLTMEVALAEKATGHPPLGTLLLWSGAILPHWNLSNARGAARRVLIAHGRADPILPFTDAEGLRDAFGEEMVTWLPFDGVHQIPRSVVQGSAALLGRLQ